MKKISSGTILVLLALSSLLIIIPVAVVHGSSGVPSIGVLDSRTAPTTFTAASSFVAVVAGTDTASADNTTAGFFAIQFSGVTFSGSQFYLYLSKDGFSDISATDVKYAGIFNVANLGGTYGVLPVQANGTFYAGLVGGVKTLEGPLPTQISSDYKYVKVFDGSTTAVAVSLQTLDIEPGISITPVCTYAPGCPAGFVVQLLGGGFPSSRTIDINYSFPFYSWQGVLSTKTGTWVSGISTGNGYFSHSETMLDAKQAENPIGVGVIYTAITLTATSHTHPQSFYSTAHTEFDQIPRVFTQVTSYKPGGSLDTLQTGPFGNDTGSAIIYSNLVQPVNAYPTGSLGIAGNNTMASSTVTITVGATVVTVTSDHNGAYLANVTVPSLSLGTHAVTVSDDGVTYQFNINIVPTLILTPTSGPVGTVVSATAYGFPANTYVSLWWAGHTYQDGDSFYVANGTVGTNGQFNVTMSFTVPHTYGGAHVVDATQDMWPSPVATTTLEAGAGWVASAVFTVTAHLTVSPSTVSNNGVFINATGTGLYPAKDSTDCPFNCLYQVNIDNGYYASTAQPYFTGGVGANASGDMSISFIASGFRPGMHVVALMGPFGPCQTDSECSTVLNSVPAAWAFFNVTTAGDPIFGAIQNLPASVSSAVTTGLASINSQLSTITSDVSGLGGQLTSIQGSLSTITSDVQGLSSLGSQMTTLGTKIDGLTSALSGVTSSLSTIQSSLTSAANNAQTAATDASNAANGASTAQTYVLVVAVLAAITLVLELAILVRKLS
jgi:uncharacterized protein YoxC